MLRARSADAIRVNHRRLVESLAADDSADFDAAWQMAPIRGTRRSNRYFVTYTIGWALVLTKTANGRILNIAEQERLAASILRDRRFFTERLNPAALNEVLRRCGPKPFEERYTASRVDVLFAALCLTVVSSENPKFARVANRWSEKDERLVHKAARKTSSAINILRRSWQEGWTEDYPVYQIYKWRPVKW